MGGVGVLGHQRVRDALRRLSGAEAPSNRAAAQRQLRELLRGYGTVRSALERAPEGAREAFVRLAQDGPANVEALLGRGWWGHGTLPPPLDWLQHRGLVHVGEDGLVHPVAEAREGFCELTLPLEPAASDDVGEVRVQAAGCVVVTRQSAALDRVLTVPGAQLQALAPTVAVSPKTATTVTAALRSAGVPLADDAVVAVDAAAPALPDTAEDAVGPRAVRTLLQRAVDEHRQVRLRYFASSRGGAATERVVDPWEFREDLLRGYCHLRAGERSFAVDRIGHARLLPTPVEWPET